MMAGRLRMSCLSSFAAKMHHSLSMNRAAVATITITIASATTRRTRCMSGVAAARGWGFIGLGQMGN